jgi:hypothetical protein
MVIERMETTSVSTPARTPEAARTESVFYTQRWIWFTLTVIEILIGLRFAFGLAGANPGAPFVSFIRAVTFPLVYPFQGIFGSPVVRNVIFDWAALLAMLLYYLLALVIVKFVFVSRKPVTAAEVQQAVQEEPL